MFTNVKAYFYFLILVFFIFSCSTMPRVAEMVPETQDIEFKSTGKSVKVGFASGGRDETAFSGSQINSRDMRKALIIAIEKSNLFSEVAQEGTKDYDVSFRIMSQDQPSFGIGMTVSLKVLYKLVNISTEDVVFEKLIISKFTAGMGDAFVGATRLKMANEGAVRENIHSFLKTISKLEL